MKLYLTPFGTLKPGRHENKEKRSPAAVFAGGFALLITLLPATQLLADQTEKKHSDTDKSVTVASSVTPGQVSHPREYTFMKRQWGIEVLFVRQTSAGYMLEFRYKVLDADKAKPLFDRQTKPLLTHAKSGAKLIVPTPAKTGALRNTNPPHTGTTYWMFFANPGKLVKPGDKVDIAIGDFRADGIVVR